MSLDGLYANPMAAVTFPEPVTRYLHIGGDIDTGLSTESEAQMKTRMPLILSNLTIHVPANGITATSTFVTRINGADGFCLCSIGSSATGYFTDTTNWDECDASALVNYALTTPSADWNREHNSKSCKCNHRAIRSSQQCRACSYCRDYNSRSR